MKKIIGLLAILAILLLGAYYGMGVVTERTLKKNITIINQSHELSVEMKQYHRSWFRSEALLNWSLHIPARTVTNQVGQTTTIPAQDYNVQLPLSIYHGPIVFTDSKVRFGFGYAKSEVVLPKTYADEFKLKFASESIPPMLNLTMFVNYWNKSTVQMNLPFFKLISKEGHSQLEWLGLTSDLNVSSNASEISGHVVIEGIRFLKEKVSTVLGKVSSDYMLHRSKFGLYLGDANLSVPSLLITNENKKLLEVNGLDIHSNSDVNDDLFHSDFKATVDMIVADNKKYGPALVEFSVANLDATILAKLNEQAGAMQQSSDIQRQQILLSMLPELPKLLSKGAELHLTALRIGMPEGTVRGNLFLSLPKVDAGNPFQLIQKIKGDAKLEIPVAFLKRVLNDSVKQSLQSKAAVKAVMVIPEAVPSTTEADIDQQAIVQTDAKLAAFIASGALSMHDADYVIELALSQGQLLVNGKPFNSAMIQF